MKSAFISGIAAAALLTAANMAGAVTPAPMVNWSGYYAGGGFGGAFARDHIQDNSVGSGTQDYNTHFNLRGGMLAAYGGYNVQQGAMVYGAEADLSFGATGGDNAAWPFGTDMKARVPVVASLRGRIGYALGDNLLYATAGFALGRITTHYYDVGPTEDSFSHTRAGLTAGVGIEHAFNAKWSGRLEFRYTRFARATDLTANTDPGWYEHNNIYSESILFGATYRF
ncbi:MAG: outer membrane beta-barrel protein [Rhodobacteraceae bacterium]|nr:outer membrane beta-barrel protein [Paracoccaceae bacterium]